MDNAEFQVNDLRGFLGATLTDIVTDGDGFVGLVVRSKEKVETVLWVQCDPEGNGPGWIAVQRIE